MFKVINAFTDADTRQVYQEGDNFPRRGQVTEERVQELSSNENKLKKPLIEPFNVITNAEDALKEDEFPKHTGGGYFELSNGEKVKGKEAAVEAEKELK
ncbi:hypothetical protein [Halobacillus massiliensis]|uniref:hypothetical protein n=1 Tax=Halobacillus massiliensis TaxID=1926286 RepID=UPI001FE7B357|nr:hypothetical protein [Halobacillus massiliensis]